MVFQDTEPPEVKAVKQGPSFVLPVRLCSAHGKKALALIFESVCSNVHIQMHEGDSGEVITVSYHCQHLSSASPPVPSALSETPSSQRFLLDFYFIFLHSDTQYQKSFLIKSSLIDIAECNR